MQYLYRGQFYGKTNETLNLDGLTLTDTEYTHEKVDWHYHEMPYFTFILQGNLIEGNKNEVYHCPAGSLIFHNWQEAHYNTKPKGYSRGFHIELENIWLRNTAINLSELQGSIFISDPGNRLLFYRIFCEYKINDNNSAISINSLMLQLLDSLNTSRITELRKSPLWVKRIKEILRDSGYSGYSLIELSEILDIHPVHLSRDFPRYFHCTLGEYIRKLKVEKSLSCISNKNLSLTQIAYECGFSDQSHFTRCFKENIGISPHEYRKQLPD